MSWGFGGPRALGAAKICRIMGILLLFAAFFLPACEMSGLGSLRGYECAVDAFYVTYSFMTHPEPDGRFGQFLIVLSGWVNPLLLLYLLSTSWKKVARIRGPLALATLLFLGVACIVVAGNRTFMGFPWSLGFPLTPLVGHYFWVAGILLILSSDWVRFEKPSAIPCA
jgi:hypothetical protein